MKKCQYKETLDLAWSFDTFVLKGRKGTRIYKEERNNHIPGMRRVTGDIEVPLPRYDYLVFEIQEKIDASVLKNIDYHHGIVVTNTSYGTELACHHPQVFHNTLLSNLESHDYIKRTWKQAPKEKGEYAFYVNPNAWQLLYNIWSLLSQGIHKGCLLAKMKLQTRKE